LSPATDIGALTEADKRKIDECIKLIPTDVPLNEYIDTALLALSQCHIFGKRNNGDNKVGQVTGGSRKKRKNKQKSHKKNSVGGRWILGIPRSDSSMDSEFSRILEFPRNRGLQC
jgi:hypothetical protein